MNYLELKTLLHKDLARWDKNFWTLYFMKPEFKLIWRYRWCNYLKSHTIMKPLYYLERFLYHHSCVRCGCDIPSHVTFGGGVKILHGWGIVINSKTIIGENFTIVSGSVIGANYTGVPKIGNNVTLGAHSLIIGKIEIGDDVEIGAGAIVTHNVPSNSVVYGDAAVVRRFK